MTERGLRRHLPGSPCRVCGGHVSMAPGRGIRCAGMSGEFVCYCTREERAGRLPLTLTMSPPAYKHLLSGPCGCGTEHGAPLPSSGQREPAQRAMRREPCLPLETRDAVYRYLLGRLPLRAEAEQDLRRRRLTDADIARAFYRSIPGKGREVQQLVSEMVAFFGREILHKVPGFVDKNGNTTFWSAYRGRDGYVVPFFNERALVTGIQLRRFDGEPKYQTARGSIYAEMYHVAGERQRDLHVVEGGLKAEVAARIGGYWTFGVAGQSLRPEHIAAIRRLGAERVVVALDREVNENTDRARERWLEDLWRAGVNVREGVWRGVR